MQGVLQYADPWGRYVELAFSGDPDAGRCLDVALSNPKRGAVAVAMWNAKERTPARVSRVFGRGRDHDHAWVIGAAGPRRRLAAMFRYVAFPLPGFMGPTVRVWRGTCGVSVSRARAGYSWTLNRDVACWFAVRCADQARKPLVLAAEVAREEIVLLYTNEREAAEAVLMRPLTASVDGVPEEWRSRFEAVQAARPAVVFRTR